MTRLAFIGGGGFAKEALEIAELNAHEVVGYVADEQGVLEVPYWGKRDSLLDRLADFDAVCIAFGATDRKTSASRAAMVRWVMENGLRGEALISPNAFVAKGSSVEQGAIVAHRVVVSVDARIGPFAILNTAAIIGHDADIGRNVTIAPAAFIGGFASVGSDSLVGPGATVLQGLKLGRAAVVGVGASVVRDAPDNATIMPLRSKTLA